MSSKSFAAVLLLLIVGCSSVSPPFERDTTWGRVLAISEEVGNRTIEVVSRMDPKIRNLLGTGRQTHPTFDIGLNKSCTVEYLDGYTHSSGMVIRTVPPGWEHLLVHEMVHWHLVSYWDTLPYVVEEGLACLVSLDLWSKKTGTINPPVMNDLSKALNLTLDKFHSVKERETREELTLAGMWVVETLGLTKLRKLSKRAKEQDLQRIPAEWILSALPLPWGPAATGL
jgi:hypothetical protein